MSIWFKDTESYDGAESATRGGMYASLVFAAMLALGIAVLLTNNGALIGVNESDPAARIVGIVFVACELAIALLAAYRFHQGKGLVAGSATLLIFVIEIAFKTLSGPMPGVLWYVVYLAVLLGLINGIRGAIAMRRFDDAVEVGNTFQ